MANQKISTKKLKAIVFTDIVDFTKISADDEQHALDIIDKQREILKPIVIEHKGEWLKEIGDGLLFSFDSSLDAVRCSINIQEALKDVEDFKIRIGIHQGDIFIKDGDVYGDDVNIASRVEGFSPEGGISISDKVYKDIQSVKDIKTSFIGHKPLKGVSQETKVRCITSNGLPEDKSNRLPEIIGYVNIYIGLFTIILFSIMVLIGLLNPEGIKLSEFLNNNLFLLLNVSFINIGFVFVLFGYSNLSFHKGVSVKSQKSIYYLSLFYSFLMMIILGQEIKFFDITLGTDYFGDSTDIILGEVISWGLTMFIYILPFILFKLGQLIYNKAFKK